MRAPSPPPSRLGAALGQAGRLAPLALGLCLAGIVSAQAQESTGSGSAGGTGTGTGVSTGSGTGTPGAASAAPVGTGAPAVGTNVNTGFGPGSGYTPGIGSASSILPATGFGGGGFGNIRDFVNTPVSRARTRTVEVNGSVGIQAGYTDNVLGAADAGGPSSGTPSSGVLKRQGSFETRVTPSIVISAEGRRGRLNLNYNPTIFYYPQVDSQSRIDQYLNASATGEIIAQLLYLDVRAYTTQTSNSNAYGPTSTNVLSRQDRAQITSLSINPYLVRDFGGLGTARLSYSLANTNTNSTSTSPLSVLNNTANGHTITQSEDASFTTGGDFGRFQHTAAVGASQFSGSGSTRSGHRNQATYDLAFAYNRFVTFTGRVGYQDLLYSGTSFRGVVTTLPYKLSEPIYSAGVKLTPNPDSSVAISYGHVDGGQSLQLDATYKPTARIALYATSSSGLTTDAQQVQSFVAGSQVNQAGITIDPRTGAPVQFSNTTNNANTANQAYRLTRTSLTAAYVLTRDTFNVSLIREERTSPGKATVLGRQNSTSTYSTVAWQHDLSANTSSNLSASYGIQDQQASVNQPSSSNPTLSATGTLTRQFTEKLSGTANYSFFRRDSSLQTQRLTVNEFLLGLVQRF
jgi:uncharacterized protein (PEP-CTERM system associated)